MPSKGELVCITTLLAAAPGLEILVFPSWMAGLRVSAQSLKAIWISLSPMLLKWYPEVRVRHIWLSQRFHIKGRVIWLQSAFIPRNSKSKCKSRCSVVRPTRARFHLCLQRSLIWIFDQGKEHGCDRVENFFHATSWANAWYTTKWRVILTPDFLTIFVPVTTWPFFLTAGE